MQNSPEIDRIIRVREVIEITSLSRANIYRKLATGEFPVPVMLGSHSVGWKLSEILAWRDALPRAVRGGDDHASAARRARMAKIAARRAEAATA